jgi:Fe-S cluster assembly ATP-binding protein
LSIFKIIILNIIDFHACLCYNARRLTRPESTPCEAFSLNLKIFGVIQMSELDIRNLHVSVEGREILKGVNLVVRQGEVHALMGPNGTGKSTLAYTLMGHPNYTVTEGEVWFKGQNIIELEADRRSHLGLFLAFQYPVAIPGVSMANFLRAAINAQRKSANPQDKGISVPEFRKLLKEEMDLLKMDHTFAGRYLNEGFSGGEKKRAEVLQMATLRPEIAVMDETDSGLDIDALRIVSEGVNTLAGPNLGVLIITHYQRILNYVKPEFVHIMLNGRIVESGGPDLALHLEEQGYDWIRERTNEEAVTA